MMSSGTQERRTKRAGALADRFRKSRSVEKCVWQGEKDFTFDVPLNSQNSRVFGFENKDNIQDNSFSHHTNRQSKKVMVSACVTCYKAVFCERKSFESQFQTMPETPGKRASSRSQSYYE